MKLTSAKNKIGHCLFFIGIIFLIFSIYNAFRYNTFYFDDIFSMTAIKLPWDKFISIIFRDVHPPLHYFILKAFVGFFGLFGVNEIIAARFSSIIGLCLLIILSYFKVKKEFGWLTFGIFTLCITSMPQFMGYIIDYRMYIWAMFFVTATFFYFYSVIKTPSLKNWTIFTFLAICAAYTHYYAAISAAMIYLLFLIYIILKNRSLIKPYIASAIICVVSYAPWLLIIKYQMGRKDSYWIAPMTGRRAIGYFYYVLSPYSRNILGNEIIEPTILGTIFLIAIIILIVYCLKYKNKDFDVKYADMGILIAILVPICGLLVSLIKFPVLHHRYLFPPIGCFWLGFSILLAKIEDKKSIFIPILAILLIVGAVGAVSFTDYENDFDNRSTAYNQTIQNTFEDNSLVITESEIARLNYGYFLTSHENVSVIQNDKYSADEINKMIKEHDGPVFYIDEMDTLTDELNLTQDQLVYEYQQNPYGLAMELLKVYRVK